MIPRVKQRSVLTILVPMILALTVTACTGGDGSPQESHAPEGSAPSASPEMKTDEGLVTGDGLRVRQSPDLDSDVIHSLSEGDVVTVQGRTDWSQKIGDLNSAWLEVSIEDTSGWTYGGYISMEDEAYDALPVVSVPGTVRLSYLPNGATAGTPPDSVEVERGATISVPVSPEGLAHDSAVFVGWNTRHDATGEWAVSGATVEVFHDMELHAQWLDIDSSHFSRGDRNRHRRYIRPVEFALGEFRLLVKEQNNYRLSRETFDDVVEPFIVQSDAFRLIEDSSSRMFGFRYYPEHRYQGDLIGVRRSGAYGFVRIRDGFSWHIEPQFEEVHPFKDGLAAVKRDGKWGYIDQDGAVVISPQFDHVYDFFHGRSVVATIKDDSVEWGIIDREGEWVLHPTTRFVRVYSFYEPTIAKATVVYGEDAAIGRSGEILLEDLYIVGERGGPPDPAFYFERDTGLTYRAEGRFMSGVYQVFDRDGNVVESGLSEARHVVKLGGTASLIADRDAAAGAWGFRDATGEWVVEPQYDYASTHSNDAGVVRVDGKVGLIGRDGNYLLEPKIENRSLRFTGSYAEARVNEEWGVLRDDGTWLIEPGYDYIEVLGSVDQPILVQDGDQRFFIDSQETVLFELAEGFEPLPYRDDVTFLYRPVQELQYDTQTQIYEVRMIDRKGEWLFPWPFTERVDDYVP